MLFKWAALVCSGGCGHGQRERRGDAAGGVQEPVYRKGCPVPSMLRGRPPDSPAGGHTQKVGSSGMPTPISWQPHLRIIPPDIIYSYFSLCTWLHLMMCCIYPRSLLEMS